MDKKSAVILGGMGVITVAFGFAAAFATVALTERTRADAIARFCQQAPYRGQGACNQPIVRSFFPPMTR